jgi:hypothetical protein
MESTLEIHTKLMGCIAEISEVWEKLTFYSKILSFQLDPLTTDLITGLALRKEGKIATYLKSSQYLIEAFLRDYNKYIKAVLNQGSKNLEKLCDLVKTFNLAYKNDPSIPSGDNFSETMDEAFATFQKQIDGHAILIEGASYYRKCENISSVTVDHFESNVNQVISLYKIAREILERYGKVWQK